MNYTAKDIESFFKQHQNKVSHVIVAHTHFRPFNSTPIKIEHMTHEAKKSLTYALNCFSKSIHKNYTNKPIRYPHKFRPLSLTTIENIKTTTDNKQTIHFNICLGNIPKHLTTTEIEIHFRYAWVKKAQQNNDIYCDAIAEYPCDSQNWFGYIIKEANRDRQLAWSTNGTWDVLNTWIPNNPQYTD